MTAIAPNGNPIQEGAITFNFPIAEDYGSQIGGLLNFLLNIACPVGTVIDACVTEDEFQGQLQNPNPETWILADGRNVAGSTYAQVTGQTTVPNFCGLFRRAKNNGRSDGKQNPDGDLTLGQYTPFTTGTHTHTYQTTDPALGREAPSGSDQGPAFQGNPNQPTSAVGGDQTAPANLTINTFIRIN